MATKQSRRTRTDTTTGSLKAFKDAESLSKYDWPADVEEMSDKEDQEKAERIFFAIMDNRTIDDWRVTDTYLAADLAITRVMKDKVQKLIDEEGTMVLGGRRGDRPIKNPLFDELAVHKKDILSLSRALSITGTQRDSRSVANAAKKELETRKTLADIEAEALLA